MARTDQPLLVPGARPLIGVVHLPPLSGPQSPGIDRILERALADATAYHAAGFDALIVENHGDRPFPKKRSPPHVPAMLGLVCGRVRQETGLPVGVNVLRNDAPAAMGVAVAAGCGFIRVNVLTGAVVADQGIVEGCAETLETSRRLLGPAARKVIVAADVHVKHAAPMADRPIVEEARDAVQRGGADVVLVTGHATGATADLDEVRRVQDAGVGAPVWVASGADETNIPGVLEVADGVIVGSAAKRGRVVDNEVDPERARRIAEVAGKQAPA